MLTNEAWRAIQEFVNRAISKRGEPFVQGKVIKVDKARKVVFLKEFGDTPIPMVAFPVQVTYQYKETSGAVTIRKTNPYSDQVEILTPRVGDTVLIAQHFGTRRLPKCLGVIISRNYIQVSED